MAHNSHVSTFPKQSSVLEWMRFLEFALLHNDVVSLSKLMALPHFPLLYGKLKLPRENKERGSQNIPYLQCVLVAVTRHTCPRSGVM